MAVLGSGYGAQTGRWRSPPEKPRFRPVRTRPEVRPGGAPTDASGNTIAWAPQPGPQTAAIQCPVTDLFYGGSRGGGKSDFLIGDFAAHAGRYGEHAAGILFRRTFSELEEIEKRALQIYGALGWSYNKTSRTFTAPNKATLKLRYLLRKEDASKYQGHQYTWMAFDEVGNWPSPEPLDLLWACLRSAHGIPCVRRVTGNPGGPGHLWVRERWIEPAPDGYRIFRYELPDTPGKFVQAVYIPSRLDDNLLLQQHDPDYENRIAAAARGSSALWKAWRYGDWWSVVGAAFEEWRSDIHVRRVNVPTGWRWAAGMDWGYSSPGWFGLVAFGPEGKMHLRWEWYFRKKTPYEVGFQLGSVFKRNRQKIPEFIALDSACWASTYQGEQRKSEAEEIQRGLKDALKQLAPPIIPAPKDRESRVVRKNLMHEALRFHERADGTMDEYGQPALTVHPDCTEFIRTLPALPLDEKDPDKVDTEAEDHPFDGFTYLLVARTPQVEKEEVQERQFDQAPEWGEWVKEYGGGAAAHATTERWSRHVP